MNKVIDAIIDREGGYVNDPNDSGGETNYGITVAVARAASYIGPMKEMPRQLAVDIYTDKYWHSVRADQLLELSPSIAEEIVDTAVNMGVSRAGTFLQRCLNVFNIRESLYMDVVVDGKIGARTIAALRQYLAKRDERTFAKALNCLQGSFYIELAERLEKDEKFVYGWLKNRVSL